MSKTKAHSAKELAEAATLFFRVRGLVRTRLAAGRKLDPYAWLRIETLVYIRDNQDAPLKDIADYLSITAPSATSLLSLLRKEKLIQKRQDTKDRRSWKVSLTPTGRRFLAKSVAQGMQRLKSVFAPLDKSELKAFSRALSRVLEGSERI